ncbi:MAG: KdsC family phosphatase, partial [Calditrichia bacterium]
GIRLVHEAGLKTGLISARESEAIRIRAKELGIHFLYLGKYDKLKSYEELKKQTGLKDENFCFIADDLPDIPVLSRVGFPVAVRNASPQAKESTRFITKREGGAVREVMEFILHTQGKLDNVLDLVIKFDQTK